MSNKSTLEIISGCRILSFVSNESNILKSVLRLLLNVFSFSPTEMEKFLSIPPFDLHSSTNNSGSPYSCKFICGNGSWSEFLLRGVEFMEILLLLFLPGKHVSCNRQELLVEFAEMLSFPLLSEISTNSSELQEESTNEFPRISIEMQSLSLYSNGSFPYRQNTLDHTPLATGLYLFDHAVQIEFSRSA